MAILVIKSLCFLRKQDVKQANGGRYGGDGTIGFDSGRGSAVYLSRGTTVMGIRAHFLIMQAHKKGRFSQ